MELEKQIAELKQIIKDTNQNMANFLRIYEKVFQMNPYGYDLFVQMDLKTEEIYHKLVQFKLANQITVDMLPTVIQKRWEHIFNAKKMQIDQFNRNDTEFDAFFWSYILGEIYIVLPYILMQLRIQMHRQKQPNEDEWRIKNSLAWFRTPTDFYATNQIFKRWDVLDQQISKLAIDQTDRAPLCHLSYEKLAETFSGLFNYYYLVLEDEQITKKILRNIYWGRKIPWIICLLLGMIVIIIGIVFGLNLKE